MGNAGFLEHVAARDESVARVERHRVDLGVDDHAHLAADTRLIDQSRNERLANAAATPRREHRDAADMAGRPNARAADRRTVRVDGERVQRRIVGAVPLERFRHTLLDDEHRVADAAQRRLGIGPACRRDRVIGSAAHR